MNTDLSFWSSGAVPLIEPEFLSSILSVASDIAIVITDDGLIQSILLNSNDNSYGNLSHWKGRKVTEFLSAESLEKFANALERFNDTGQVARPVELNHTDNANWAFPIRYTFHQIGSEGLILMMGRDLRPIAETQQQLVQAQMALERGYEARREFDSRYRMLLSATRDAVMFVSVGTGRIIDLNEAAAQLLGGLREALSGTNFAQEFQSGRGSGFVESLVSHAVSEKSADVRAETRRQKEQVLIQPTGFRAAGERVLLLRLEKADAATKTSSDTLTTNLAALYAKGADAFVFTSAKGVIESANESFLDLADAPHLADVRGRSLADFLARGQVDLSVLLEHAKREEQMRVYSTKLTNDYAASTPIEISATWLNDRARPQVGFVIRDSGRSEAFRHPATPGETSSQSNVVELVGSASLKDIVAETTDVVEKMCIETAVSLTRNNRVAAAEMLGLSRQSLYVKLRKYGLLARDTDNDE